MVGMRKITPAVYPLRVQMPTVAYMTGPCPPQMRKKTPRGAYFFTVRYGQKAK